MAAWQQATVGAAFLRSLEPLLSNSLPDSKAVEEPIQLLYEGLEEYGKTSVKAAEMDAKDRERSPVHNQILYLEKGVDDLKDKKITLVVDMLQNKKSKAMYSLLKEQKREVEEEIRSKTERLRRLDEQKDIADDMISTPQHHNRTPESGTN